MKDIERMDWGEFLESVDEIRVAVASGTVSREEVIEVGAKALDKFTEEVATQSA